MRNTVIGIMSIVIAGCRTGIHAERLVADIEVTPAATEVAHDSVVSLVPKLKGGRPGHTKYEWSVDAPACKGGLRASDTAVTEFLPPPGCKGNVSIHLTLRRGDEQAETHRVLRIADPAATTAAPAPAPAGAPRSARPDVASLLVPFDRYSPFQEGGAVKVAAAERSGGLVISFALGRIAPGFGGVCLPLPGKVVDLGGYGALEFEAALREGKTCPLQVKLERSDRNCPDCQCYLHNRSASELPRAASHKVRLPLDDCQPMLGDVARICFATNADQWEAPGRLQLEARDVRFVR